MRVETLVGYRLPTWLRERLLSENGFVLDDSSGATGVEWHMLAVMDRTDRKHQSRTGEDIAWHTKRARAIDQIELGTGFDVVSQPGHPFPEDGVMIGWGSSQRDRLLLLPDMDHPDLLGLDVYRQSFHSPVVSLGVALPDLAPSLAELETLSDEPLPVFKYHPDPVATESIRRSPNACPVCLRRRGWEYVTSPYGTEELDHLCPWCIADGSAARRGAEFTDPHPLIEAGLDDGIIAKVTERTPGFPTFQQEEWQVCCDDACAFIGALSPDQIHALPASMKEDNELTDEWVAHLDETDFTVFGFRCLHCGSIKIWLDFC